MVSYRAPSYPVRINYLGNAVVYETTRPRSWRKWVHLAIDALGLIPALRAPAKVLRLAMEWLNGDYFSFVLTLADMACIPGILGIVVKVVSRVRRLWQDACFGAAVACRARCLASC